MASESYAEWKFFVRNDFSKSAKKMFEYISRDEKAYLSIDLANAQGYTHRRSHIGDREQVIQSRGSVGDEKMNTTRAF